MHDWHEFSEDVDETPEENRRASFVEPSLDLECKQSNSQIKNPFFFGDDVFFDHDNQSNRSSAVEQLSSSESLGTNLTVEGEQEHEDFIVESNDSDAQVCLKELNVSSSHRMLFVDRFPIPEDPGTVPGFWILFPKPPDYDNDGIQKFRDLIKFMKLQPIQKILEALKTDEINLRYYGLDPRAVRAICEAALHNRTVKTLDLQDNWLTVDACFHLNDFLATNVVLTTLNISGCRIGSRGAKRLEQGIGAAPALQYLNVSRCDLCDEGLQYIITGVYCSSSLLAVDFTDNNLGDGSGAAFQTMLTQTDTVTQLNLSWNSLFSQEFWIKFAAGLNRNLTLIDLDMSWNNLKNDCLSLLEKYLSNSTTLKQLNLRDNRFEIKEAAQIAKIIRKNTTLEALYLGNNPFGSEGALDIIKSLTPQASPKSQLRNVDLENIWTSKDALPSLEAIESQRPELIIKLGGILSNYKLIGPNEKKIFLKRANFEAMKPKKITKRKDFGQFILSLEDSIISKGAFKKLVRRYKIQLTKSLVEEIMNAFAIGPDAVDQLALKKFYRKEYPDTKPAPPKSKKKMKKNIKKIKTSEHRKNVSSTKSK